MALTYEKLTSSRVKISNQNCFFFQLNMTALPGWRRWRCLRPRSLSCSEPTVSHRSSPWWPLCWDTASKSPDDLHTVNAQLRLQVHQTSSPVRYPAGFRKKGPVSGRSQKKVRSGIRLGFRWRSGIRTISEKGPVRYPAGFQMKVRYYTFKTF